jgi:hypothetical protein
MNAIKFKEHRAKEAIKNRSKKCHLWKEEFLTIVERIDHK